MAWPTVPHAIITWTVTWCGQHHAHCTPCAHSHYALQHDVYNCSSSLIV